MKMPAWKTSNVIVAVLYAGGPERLPSSHVANSAAEFIIIPCKAIAVALETCGAVLFGTHVASGGASQYVPGRNRKSEP